MKFGKKDSALVITDKGGLEVILPKETEVVSDGSLMLVAISQLISDNNEKFMKLVLDKVDSIITEINKVKNEKRKS